jgi:uncharacterized cupredoxin-like copper-binding protein
MVPSRARVLRLGVVLLAAACSSGGGASLTPTSVASTPLSASPAGRPVEVTLKDFSITVQPQGVTGPLSFHVTNQGTMIHEFDIFQSALPLDGLPIDKSTSKVDEGSGSLRVIEASASINAGESPTIEVTLPPGRYYFVCNQPGHYQLGMRVEYVVG